MGLRCWRPHMCFLPELFFRTLIIIPTWSDSRHEMPIPVASCLSTLVSIPVSIPVLGWAACTGLRTPIPHLISFLFHTACRRCG